MSYPTHLCPLQALEDGESLDALYEYTKIDPWFLAQVGRRRDSDEWGRCTCWRVLAGTPGGELQAGCLAAISKCTPART